MRGSDRRRADGPYSIVASEGTDFVVKMPTELAKTKTKIIQTKVAEDWQNSDGADADDQPE